VSIVRAFIGGALLAALLAGPAAAIQDKSVTAPIEAFLLAFNGGDMKVAAAQFVTGGTSIIDEFAPHYWVGPAALTQWAADYGKDSTARGITDGKVTLGKPTRVEVEAGVAYVITPAHYTFEQKGTPMVEDGAMTFALKGKAKGWKIAAWTWSGPPPHALK
jgi:hypothetical protein